MLRLPTIALSILTVLCSAKVLALDWQIQSLPNTPSLRASSANFGQLWVAGTQGQVYKSLDAGNTWQAVAISSEPEGDIRDLQQFADGSVLAMTVGPGQSSGLYRSTDGGLSWQLWLQNEQAEGFFNAIDFWDQNQGLLFGDPVDGFYVVMKTADGGKSWRRIPKAQLPAILDKEAAFAASGNTLKIQDKDNVWIATGGFSASAYHSDDGGEHWQRVSLPIHQLGQTGGAYAIGLNSNNEVFALGGDFQDRPGKYPNLAKLTAQGAQRLDAGERGLRTAMACIEAICLATGKTGTDISYDHGISWQAFSEQGFYTLAADKQTFVGAGHDGRVGILNLNQLKPQR
ncbi:WD40/YVTN/BNR-like repeat-containing protein [Bowmanella yangjiangensis]|uniref:Oxidoreductase n=1 Tax=Bowmanella yangjiangensis TaxID=2811230 RepID=A0ABS3CT09_9ALTE|nr:oxidoreductase [Bowmanella yangjiangensis]MBN7819644.1 oxidoreductase [Bowmanella yangjiangensis]